MTTTSQTYFNGVPINSAPYFGQPPTVVQTYEVTLQEQQPGAHRQTLQVEGVYDVGLNDGCLTLKIVKAGGQDRIVGGGMIVFTRGEWVSAIPQLDTEVVEAASISSTARRLLAAHSLALAEVAWDEGRRSAMTELADNPEANPYAGQGDRNDYLAAEASLHSMRERRDRDSQ